MFNESEVQQLDAIDTILRSISPEKLLQLAEQDLIIERLSGLPGINQSFVRTMYNQLAYAQSECLNLRVELNILKDEMRIMVKAMRTLQNGASSSYSDLAPLCSKYGHY